MEFMEQQWTCSTMDQYKIIKTLGSGYHATVKLAMDPNGIQVAIKRYRIDTADLNVLNKELNIMKDLNHQNLIKLIDARDKAEYKNRKGQVYKCLAIILEYASSGELFSYLANTGKFSEKVARTYFNQMMNGLYYLHKMGYAHRDLKPQNILLSHDFVLKIADFGFATMMQGREGTGVLHTNLGSAGYKAPQIVNKNYVGWQVDVFAAGVILFIMIKGSPPFSNASLEDRIYTLIKDKNYKYFWKLHCQKNPKLFSQEFKDLFVRMVAFDPTQRPTIEQLAGHAWVRKQVCTHTQIIQQFSIRRQKVKQAQQKNRQQQELKKQQRMMNMNPDKTRSGQKEKQFFQSYFSQVNKKRELPKKQIQTVDGFIINQKVEYFIADLKNYLKNQTISIEEVDQDQQELISDQQQETEEKIPNLQQYLKFQNIKESLQNNQIQLNYVYLQKLGQHEIKSNIEVMINLGSKTTGTKENSFQSIVVNIRKLKGQHIFYKKIVHELKKEFLYCLATNEK